MTILAHCYSVDILLIMVEFLVNFRPGWFSADNSSAHISPLVLWQNAV